MNNAQDVREFLTTRRARVTPEQVGLPSIGNSRRVPGLRREEVAMLAGVSVDYYTRLERGNLSGASEAVLHALADALRLDEAERMHLFDLAHAATPSVRPRKQAPSQVRPNIQRLLDMAGNAPAFVRNARMDILASNPLARALYGEAWNTDKPNSARFTYLDPRAKTFFRDWERVARETAATMRSEMGKVPHDREFSNLIGELTTQSEDFAQWWAAHDVKLICGGPKLLSHPVVGDIDMTCEVMDIRGDHDVVLVMYVVEPNSPSAERLQLLASWAASEREQTLDVPAPETNGA